jgi:hypothetical protein
MTLGDIYRDIYSRIIFHGINQAELLYLDVVNTINDVIKQQRVEYVKNGLTDYFSETQSFAAVDVTPSTSYPYLNEVTLAKSPIKDLPLSMVVISANAYATETELTNSLQTISKGTYVTKGPDLYYTIKALSNENGFTKTFDPSVVKNYDRNNGASYKTGDVVKELSTGKYFKIVQDFVALFDDVLEDIEISSNPVAEELNFVKVGTAYIPLVNYPLNSIQQLRLFENELNAAGFTVDKRKVYVTPNIKRFTITYVPNWTPVTTMAGTLELPDAMLLNVKIQVLQILSAKLGVKLDEKQ